MKIALHPIARLVRRHGRAFRYVAAAEAHSTQPWKPAEATAPIIHIKGLIQQRIPVRDADLPDGQTRGIAILLIEGDQDTPSPGDFLEADGSRWRIQTILPIGKSRDARLIEAILIGQSGGQNGQGGGQVA